MTYEKPEVRDFGSIAEHTYGVYGFIKDCFPGGSGQTNWEPRVRDGWDD